MPIALAALAIAAAGAVTSTVGGIQQGKAQKSMERMKARQQAIEAARERTKQIRAARQQRAQILQAGANQGAGDSSSVQAGAAGAISQAFQNIGDINRQESAGKAMSAGRQDILNAQGVQTVGAGMTQLGGALFGNSEEIGDIFGIKST